MGESEKRKFIRNLWFLMLYASEFFAYIDENKGASKAENPDKLVNLIAYILTKTVELRLHRNLNFSYEPRQEILRRVKGRIDLLKTERRQLLQKAQIACRFEELTIDTPRNRFVRDALDKMAVLVNDDKVLANTCRSQALKLRQAGVNGLAPPKTQMQNIRYGRNDKNDKKMVFAAILAFELALPDESAGFNELFSPDYENKSLERLYEKAITNFYEKVLGKKGWKISGQKQLYWDAIKDNEEAKKILPIMKTDIILDNKNLNKNIIVDTKFKNIFNEGNHKLHSDNIYQIYTYLSSQQGKETSPVKAHAEGLLLYPCVGEEVDKTFRLQDFDVRFATVDFLGDERSIRKRLIEIIESSMQ